MAMLVPLPRPVRDRAKHITHPGLLLDKYVESWDPDVDMEKLKLSETVQKPAIQAVVKLSQNPPLELDFPSLLRRWQGMLDGLRADRFAAKTIGPLTLHLARASALENAGICLHPMYGFAYLPGSGLKGMAHAYACELWLPGQPDKQYAWDTVCRVFGWAPSPWLKDLARRCGVRCPTDSRAGAIIFHDAWPRAWPRLAADIVNNHHPGYYQSAETAEDHPPGDWENPVPVNFLAVPPGTEFLFAICGRRDDACPETEHPLPLARDWLQGAICHLGAGAKTAAGYGVFQLLESATSSNVSPRSVWTGALSGSAAQAHESLVRLRLVTPAFLGGPERHAHDTARLSSLRGQLRSWWRAWHGHLTTGQLKQLEAAAFGSLATGAGMTLLPARYQPLKIMPRRQNMGGGGSALGYLGYGPIGYDRPTRANLTQLDALAPDQVFEVRVIHRSPSSLAETLKSLWLLTALGGCGSRSRRGWGSLALEEGFLAAGLPELGACNSVPDYRTALTRGLEQLAPLAQRKSAVDLEWTAISRETRIALSATTFASWRAALEDLGKRFQQFRSYDGRGSRTGPNAPPGPDYHATKAALTGPSGAPTSLPERAGFGLPYAQAYRSLNGARASFTPVWREGQKMVEGRRASQVFCKIARLADGKFLWQVAWLPSRFLPKGATVQGTRTDLRPPRSLPGSPYRAPGPFGVARNTNDAGDTLIRDFLDFLEGKTAGAPAGGQSDPADHAREKPGTSRPEASQSPSGGDRARPKKPAAAPPKPVNQGQTRVGKLFRHPEGWVVVFEGDAREAVITNPEKLPTDLKDGAKADFWIESASKNSGIRARFERLRETPTDPRNAGSSGPATR